FRETCTYRRREARVVTTRRLLTSQDVNESLGERHAARMSNGNTSPESVGKIADRVIRPRLVDNCGCWQLEVRLRSARAPERDGGHHPSPVIELHRGGASGCHPKLVRGSRQVHL